jgi:hypothetical protein
MVQLLSERQFTESSALVSTVALRENISSSQKEWVENRLCIAGGEPHYEEEQNPAQLHFYCLAHKE